MGLFIQKSIIPAREIAKLISYMNINDQTFPHGELSFRK